MALRHALRRASTMAFASGSSSRASMLDAAAEAYAAAAAALPDQPDLVMLFQSGVGSSVGDADAIAELMPPETYLIGHSAAGGREPRTQVSYPRTRTRTRTRTLTLTLTFLSSSGDRCSPACSHGGASGRSRWGSRRCPKRCCWTS